MKKEPEKKVIPIKYQCTFSVEANALFTETHCRKECQWLVYGHVNLIPTNPIGICCAFFETLELDYKTNNFKRTGKCINTVEDYTKGGDDA